MRNIFFQLIKLILMFSFISSQTRYKDEIFSDVIKTEDVVTEHGLLNVQKEDLEDESQFLYGDSAEDIDEEDKEIGLSDEMKGVYKS